MTDHGSLTDECRTLTRFLIGEGPTDYVVAKYAEAHHALELEAGATAFDRALMKFARRGWVAVKIADSYAAVFAPQGLLRKKLVSLLAILETCPPSYRIIDRAPAGSPSLLVVRLAGRGVVAVVTTMIGVFLFLPLHLLTGGRSVASRSTAGRGGSPP